MGGRFRTYAAAALILQGAAACSQRDDAPIPLATASPPVPAATHAVSGPKRTVLAFGDSLYAGYGLRPGQSLPDAVRERLRAGGIDATVINAGVSGDTTADGRRRLAYTLDRLERKPDLVMLGLGGNDVLRQIPPQETRANMAAMLAELDRRAIPVLLTGMMAPPNLGPDYAARINSIWPDLAREHHATLYPFILDGVLGRRQWMLPDGIHPNATGVQKIADRVAPLVSGKLKELPAA